MPLPKPHYQPEFTPEQLAQARKVVAQPSAPQREAQRARLTPRDFPSVAALRERLYQFQYGYNQRAEPFRWQYTRTHLEAYIERLALHEERFTEAAACIQQRRECGPSSTHCLTH